MLPCGKMKVVASGVIFRLNILLGKVGGLVARAPLLAQRAGIKDDHSAWIVQRHEFNSGVNQSVTLVSAHNEILTSTPLELECRSRVCSSIYSSCPQVA